MALATDGWQAFRIVRLVRSVPLVSQEQDRESSQSDPVVVRSLPQTEAGLPVSASVVEESRLLDQDAPPEN